MSLRSRTLGLACLLLAIGWGSAAQAQQYLLTSNSGGQAQIGTGLPLPVGTAGIFTGGTSAATAGTAFWPPLLIPPVSPQTGGHLISQTGGTANGGAIIIPPNVLSKPAAGTPNVIGGLFPTNPGVFQVATTISYAWPAVTATLAPGGGPGIPGTTVTQSAQGGSITYTGSAAAFGGPAQISISTGPGAAGGRVGPNAASVPPVASVWINFQGKLPASATRIGLAGASNPAGVGQVGAPTGAPTAVTNWGPVTAGNPNGGGVGAINVTPAQTIGGTPAGITCCTVTPAGSLANGSLALPANFLSNMVTGSKGFPWTTAFITLSQPAAGEVFFQSGTDMRVGGVGNISLVSGALSTRALSGPNANRGWLSLTLPEPTAALGAAGALGMLGLLHGLVRRRSR